MTTVIEKMFENANIKPKQEGYCDWDSDCPYPDIINSGCGDECPYWKYKDEANYPPFTAEKQIELIKWLAKIYELRINWNEQHYSYHFVVRDYKNIRLNHSVCNYEVPFEETLAYLINRIWQNLTDQEKEEIRIILNE